MVLAIVLFVVLGVVTLVGHGLWVLLAKLFGGDRGRPVSDRCPKCGTWLAGPIGGCRACGWAASRSAEQRRQEALQSLVQQIVALEHRRLLDPTIRQQLVEAIISAQKFDAEQVAAAAQAVKAAPANVPVAKLVPQPLPTEEGEFRRGEPQPITLAENVPPTALDIPERVRHYAERQQSLAGEQSDIPAPIPSRARRPARPWSEVLAAFLEKSNIRWGELIGGLLIVCCSIALVISFWAEIAERPFLKFFVFNGVTAALFGVGFYSHRKWRLETTSQGLLIIATLLVPLNFLAIAALSAGEGETRTLTIVGEVVSTVIFSAFIYLAARITLPVAAWALVAMAMIPSVATLLVGRYVSPETSAMILHVLTGVPLATYAAGNAVLLARQRNIDPLREAEAGELFKLLGIGTFAVFLPLGLLLANSGRRAELVHDLSPWLTLLSFPALCAGLLLWRQLDRRESPWLRVAGSSIGVLGACVLAAANVLAWPEPWRMVPVAILSAGVFAIAAMASRIREAHALVAVAIGWAVLVLTLVFVEGIAWQASAGEMILALVSRTTAMALVPLSFLSALAAAVFATRQRRVEGWCYALAAGGMAAASAILVSWLGWGVVGDTSGAVWVYAIYAVACLAAAWFLNRPSAAWLGAVLLCAALAQALVYTFAEVLALSYPWLTVLLAHAVVCAALGTATRILSTTDRRQALRWAMLAAAFATSLAAAALVVYLTPTAAALVPAVTWSILAGLWLVIGVCGPWLSVFSVAQLALVLAVIFLVGSGLSRFDWFIEARYPWLDPWSLAAVGIGLVGLGFAWLLFRRALLSRVSSDGVSRTPEHSAATSWIADLQQLLWGSRPPLDYLLAIGTTLLLLVLAVYAAAPGAMQELSPREIVHAQMGGVAEAESTDEANNDERPRQTPRIVPPIEAFAVPEVPHSHAASIGSWVLLTSLVVLLVISLRLEYQAWKGILLVVELLAAPLLLAALAEGDVAVASALRWLSTVYLLVGSAAIWARRPLMQVVRATGLGPPYELARGASGPLRSGVLVLSLVPLVAMFCYVGLAAVLRSPLPAEAGALFGIVGGIALVMVAGAALLRYAPLKTDAGVSAGQASTLLVVLGVAPLIAVSLYVVTAAMRQSPIVGPEPESWFAQMGTATSYAVPILVTALVLVGYALRERDAAFAFGGALVLAVAATAGYLLWSAKQGLAFDLVQWVRLAQLNAAVCATYAIAWVGIRDWVGRREQRMEVAAMPLLATLVCIGPALLAIVLLTAAFDLFWHAAPSPVVGEVGSTSGWVSLVLSTMALVLVGGVRRIGRAELVWIWPVVLAVGLMLAATASHWDTGNWLAFHMLLVALATSAVAALVGGWLEAGAITARLDDRARGRFVTVSATALAIITVMVAVRSMSGDPQAPWWAAGGCVAMSVVAAGLACWSTWRTYVVAAGLLLNLALTLVWIRLSRSAGWPSVVDLNLMTLVLPAPLWLLLDRYQRSVRLKLAASAVRLIGLPGVAWHLAATWLALGVLILQVGAGLAGDLRGIPAQSMAAWNWGVWGAAGVGVVSCLWDAAAKSRVAALYWFGLVGTALLVDTFDLAPRRLAWTSLMVLAAFGVGTSYLWSIREQLRRVAMRLRIPPGLAPREELWWLIPCNVAIAIGVVALAFWVQFNFAEAELRVGASQAALAQAVSLGLLAWGRARSPLQYAALLTGALGTVAFGWSWLEPETTGTVLNRAVVALAAVSAMAALYGLGLSKLIRRINEWTIAAERLVPVLLAAAAAILIFVLGFEAVEFFTTGTTTISWPALVTVAVVLVGLCAAALVAAVVPGRDPLGLSERGRMAYVYAAEIILALLFLHIRLTMPWLFSGFFRRYWPFVVMLLAFVGVGLAELFRRQRRMVLAEPLERSGAFLPLLPVLGFWFVPSETHFSVIMVAAAGIYAVLSIMRRSFVYGVLAAAAANGGLWYLLAQADGWGLFEHPQLWFIPPALCVFAAAYLNREHLGDTELATIRYAAATVIYVSSTADIFLVGVAEAPWLPLVLAALSLVGIFAGIWLRVRSFLLLGTGFLVLALLTVIWYAAVDLEQTWVWSVSGIIAGVLIIALFAVFEKKRQEVLGVLAQLKEWEQ